MNAVSHPSAPASFVEDYAVAAGRLAEAVAHTDLRAPVAACPGWTAYDAVVHLGNVHAWAATIVETGRSAPEQDDRPRSSRPRHVAGWYAAKAEDLLLVLRATVPERPCWNFVRGSGPARFWQRRQLHETLVHLVDVDRSAGRGTEVDARVAADGVDEVLQVMLPRMHSRGHRAHLERPLRLVASDTGDAWGLEPVEGPPAVVRGDDHLGPVPPDGDAVVAPAEGLYRLLWHRADAVADVGGTVTGDGDRVQAFLRSALVP